MEIISKGKGEKGVVWVARKIPDDSACAHASDSSLAEVGCLDARICDSSSDSKSAARPRSAGSIGLRALRFLTPSGAP